MFLESSVSCQSRILLLEIKQIIVRIIHTLFPSLQIAPAVLTSFSLGIYPEGECWILCSSIFNSLRNLRIAFHHDYTNLQILFPPIVEGFPFLCILAITCYLVILITAILTDISTSYNLSESSWKNTDTQAHLQR